jgi:hypothetical protein
MKDAWSLFAVNVPQWLPVESEFPSPRIDKPISLKIAVVTVFRAYVYLGVVSSG